MVKEKHSLISLKAFPGIFWYFRKHSQGILYNNPKNILQNITRGIPRDSPGPKKLSKLFLVAIPCGFSHTPFPPFLVFKENVSETPLIFQNMTSK